MGFTSSAFRRWICGTKILRCNRNPCYLLNAKRMVSSTTTSGGVSPSGAPLPSPWLMMKPIYEKYGPGQSIIRFCSLASNEIYYFCTPQFRKLTEVAYGFQLQILGSSNGRLGLYSRHNHDVWLFDPFTDRLVSLPSMGTVVHALSFVGNTRLPIAAAGSGRRLALCRGGAWTPLSSDRACESLSYSSRRNRLLCITRARDNKPNLEIWDLGERAGDTPKCEWEMDLNAELRNRKKSSNNNLKKLMYVACAEHSGEVFVVVRHVRIKLGNGGYFVDGIAGTDYMGGATTPDPFKTDHFKVYKVDEDGRRLILMKDSLEGMAIFVGTNLPVAIPAKDVAGVKPDSVYFTYDRRIRYTYGMNEPEDEGSRIYKYGGEDDGTYEYGGEDNGTYDYRNMKFSPVYAYDHYLFPVEPVWFTSP